MDRSGSTIGSSRGLIRASAEEGLAAERSPGCWSVPLTSVGNEGMLLVGKEGVLVKESLAEQQDALIRHQECVLIVDQEVM